MDVSSALLSLSLALTQLTGIVQKGIPTMASVADDIFGTLGDADKHTEVHLVNIKEHEDSRICWLNVPGYVSDSGDTVKGDSVLVRLNQKNPEGKLFEHGGKFLVEPGVISYVDPVSFQPLPYGLFCWQSAWSTQKLEEPYKKSCIGATPNTIISAAAVQTFAPKTNRHPNNRAVRRWIYQDIVDRNKDFERVMGMSEGEFRKKLGVVRKLSVSTARTNFKTLHPSLPADIKKLFPEDIAHNKAKLNQFVAHPVSELRRRCYKPSYTYAKEQRGRLFLIRKSDLDKGWQGYKADIRYLQAHFPNAVFQIASTFSSMEGGVRSYKEYLNEMNDRAVQGENAVLGTISGAIVRRYFVEPFERNLLSGVASIFHGAGKNWEPSIKFMREHKTYEMVIKQTSYNGLGKGVDMKNTTALYLGLAGAIKVGVHTNIFVTSGSWGQYDIQIPRFDAPRNRTVSAFDQFMDKPHRVNHVYTSAIDVNPHHEHLKADPNLLAFLQDYNNALPKMALRAAYEGTILGAWDLFKQQKPIDTMTNLVDFLTEDKRPRVFLTLVGGSSFGNRPEWIVTILEQLQALIALSGLQIGLVLWDGDEEVKKVIPSLDALAARIGKGDLDELSKSAKLAGEALWLFNNDGSFAAKGIALDSHITVPFKTPKGKEINLGILQNFIQ